MRIDDVDKIYINLKFKADKILLTLDKSIRIMDLIELNNLMELLIYEDKKYKVLTKRYQELLAIYISTKITERRR
jgi:hypothetical protein